MSNYTKDADAMSRLSPEDLAVTQQNGTERPFENAYWDHDEPGIYVDIVSGEPLFSSLDKFDSNCGWPSFTKPVEAENVAERPDGTHGMSRTEVRSIHGDSHLGHVFDDGPKGAGGLRYCIDSASLRFIPVDELESEGHPGVISTRVGYTGGELPNANRFDAEFLHASLRYLPHTRNTTNWECHQKLLHLMRLNHKKTVRLSPSEAIFARNLFGATPAEAVSCSSSKICCRICFATRVAVGKPVLFSVTSSMPHRAKEARSDPCVVERSLSHAGHSFITCKVGGNEDSFRTKAFCANRRHSRANA